MNQRWYKRFRTPPLNQSDYSNLLHHDLNIYIHTDSADIHHVSVGLIQAHPNYVSTDVLKI